MRGGPRRRVQPLATEMGRPVKASVGEPVSVQERRHAGRVGRGYCSLFVRASQASGSGSGEETEVLRIEERKGVRSSWPVARRTISI